MFPMSGQVDQYLEQIVFMSSASHLMSEEELVEVLDNSRLKYEMLDVSGMLVYSEGTFIHVLEGNSHLLDCLYEMIRQDQKHHRCFILLRHSIRERAFEGWSMGFQSFSPEVQNIPGYVDFFGEDLLPDVGSPAYCLLNSFRKQNAREADFLYA